MINELMRRRALLSETGENIPYQEIEWLQSADNYGYIDTNVLGDGVSGSIYRWEAKIGYAQSSNRKFVASFNNPNYLLYCEINVNGVYGSFLGNQSASITTPHLDPNTMYNAYMQINAGYSTSSYVYVNNAWQGNVATSAQSVISSSFRFRLFYLSSGFGGLNVRIGRNKIFHNGALLRDFVPVRINTTGYMYDKVSGELFPVTGQFILGNDIN